MNIKSFVNRKIYMIERRINPKVKLQHKLDSMVGPFGYWEQLQQYQFNLLKTFGLQTHHQLLDIGCGPLQGGVAFIKYLNPNCYVGIDLRERVIEEAYLQIIREKLAAKNPFLAVADDFGKKFLTRKFDYISTFQLLYHLEEHQVDSLFQMAGDVLNQTGIFLCDIIGYPNKVCETSEWSGFKFHLHTKDFIKNTSIKYGLIAESLGAIEQYGYPSEISLKTNILFKISKREMGP